MPRHNLRTSARKSERVLVRIPIRVEGKDAMGKGFDEPTYTLVVGRSGGQIILPHLLALHSVIKITNLKTSVSSSFRVVERVARSLTGTPAWGVECLAPDLDIWGIHFPAATQEPSHADTIHVLLECQACLSREMATLTVQQYRKLAAESTLPRPCPKCSATRNWRFAFIEVEAEEVLSSLAPPSGSEPASRTSAEKRGDKRLMLKLPVGVRLPDGSEETSTTENISKSGLCFACGLEMHAGETLLVRVGLDSPEEQHELAARIMWRRPAKEKGRALYGVKLERR
jgi:hypothetical protein